jgi:hypothetical protein
MAINAENAGIASFGSSSIKKTWTEEEDDKLCRLYD